MSVIALHDRYCPVCSHLFWTEGSHDCCSTECTELHEARASEERCLEYSMADFRAGRPVPAELRDYLGEPRLAATIGKSRGYLTHNTWRDLSPIERVREAAAGLLFSELFYRLKGLDKALAMETHRWIGSDRHSSTLAPVFRDLRARVLAFCDEYEGAQ